MKKIMLLLIILLTINLAYAFPEKLDLGRQVVNEYTTRDCKIKNNQYICEDNVGTFLKYKNINGHWKTFSERTQITVTKDNKINWSAQDENGKWQTTILEPYTIKTDIKDKTEDKIDIVIDNYEDYSELTLKVKDTRKISKIGIKVEDKTQKINNKFSFENQIFANDIVKQKQPYIVEQHNSTDFIYSNLSADKDGYLWVDPTFSGNETTYRAIVTSNTYIKSDAVNTNYGTETTLYVCGDGGCTGGGYRKQAYVKYNITNIKNNISQTNLKLTHASLWFWSTHKAGEFYFTNCNSSAWSQTTLTFANHNTEVVNCDSSANATFTCNKTTCAESAENPYYVNVTTAVNKTFVSKTNLFTGNLTGNNVADFTLRSSRDTTNLSQNPKLKLIYTFDLKTCTQNSDCTAVIANSYCAGISGNGYCMQKHKHGETCNSYQNTSTERNGACVQGSCSHFPYYCNRVPTIASLFLNSSLGTFFYTEPMKYYITTATDPDSDQIRNCSTWVKNGVLFSQLPCKYGMTGNFNLSNGLIAFYPMDDNNNTIFDYSMHNYGINKSARWVSNGKIKGAFSYQNGNSWLNISDSTSLNNLGKTSTTFSFALWVYMNYSTITGSSQILSKTGSAGTERGFTFMAMPAAYGFLPWFQILNATASCTSAGTTQLNDSKWHFVTGTYDGAALKYYKDSTLEKSTACTVTKFNNTLDIGIGAYPDGTYKFTTGIIDEVTIWNRTLTDKEIQRLYYAGLIYATGINSSSPSSSTTGTNWTISYIPMDRYDYGATSTATKTTSSHRFKFRREVDNSTFNRSGTNSMSLDIYCKHQTIHQEINRDYVGIYVPCTYDFMKINVFYNNSASYFRTLIPETSEKDITWYLLDLIKDVGVQIDITLNDLTGQYNGSYLRATRYINSTSVDIIEELFDIENKVTLYFLKNAVYSISITNKLGQTRSLGDLIADQADSKVITIPNIPFSPDNLSLGGNIAWDWAFTEPSTSSGNGSLRLSYRDLLNQTTLINLTLYNYSNNYKFYQVTYAYPKNWSTIYSGIKQNITYKAVLRISNPNYPKGIYEVKLFKAFGKVNKISGWSQSHSDAIKKYLGLIIFIIVGGLFTRINANIGLVSLGIMMFIFLTIGWWASSWFSWSVFAVLALIITLRFIASEREAPS